MAQLRALFGSRDCWQFGFLLHTAEDFDGRQNCREERYGDFSGIWRRNVNVGQFRLFVICRLCTHTKKINGF